VRGREGVGREALVDERERRDEQRIRQVVVEGRDLLGEEEPLVGDRPRGEARDVEALAVAEARGANGGLDALADHVELALERLLVARVTAGADEHLPHGGEDRPRERSRRLRVDRHPAPAEHDPALLGDDLLDDRRTGPLLVGLGRQEDHADAVPVGRRQRDARRRALPAEERIGDLHQDAGAVARQRITAAGAAVREVLEHGERLPDDVVRALALHVDDESDAARVALGARIEKPAAHALPPCAARSPFRRARFGGGAGGWRTASCTRSVCVERTTIVSVRATPSSERIWLMRRSSEDVFAVLTFRRSVYSPVTWW